MSVRLPTLPRTRGDCADAPRPCMHVHCRYHLGLAAHESCTLDVTDRGSLGPVAIGRILGVDESTVRETERSALRKLRGRYERG